MKEGISFIWNSNGKFIEQSWTDLSEKIMNTHGGLGIVAADFVELLHYQSAPFNKNLHNRRMGFAEITKDAVQEKDIKLLAKILAAMALIPSDNEREWFVYFLRKASDIDEFDVNRAVSVINELAEINHLNALMLLHALRGYMIETTKGEEVVLNLLMETGLLKKTIVDGLPK